MPILGVTGGIATGKSTFSAKIAALLPAEIFDADRAGHALLENSEKIGAKIREAFGQEILAEDGTIDRAKLRESVFGDDLKRRALEGILHPEIRAGWLARVAALRVSGDRGWLIIDIPLLYETHAELHVDAVVVVACSSAVQRRRLTEMRKLPESIAAKMMNAQIDLSVKIQNADYVVWNDGTSGHLDAQAGLLARHLAIHE